MWAMRGGNGEVLQAWKVDNPLRTHLFRERRENLKALMGREADGLEGFHGTHPDAVLSICENGFDKNRRSGQVYGAGEYFAKNPSVSIGYCRGGEYMLVCRLTLGVESSSPKNTDGDHIWVPDMSYYVISSPAQILPLYIVRFDTTASASYGGRVKGPRSVELEKVLGAGSWTTKKAEAIV